jgi:Predicted Permease Membrane Region
LRPNRRHQPARLGNNSGNFRSAGPFDLYRLVRFQVPPAILFGAYAGTRSSNAALALIQETANSKIPALGFAMPYAVANTMLTLFGMVIVLLS